MAADVEDLAATWGDRAAAEAWGQRERARLGPGRIGAARPDEVFCVHADNVAAGRVFVAMATQWRVSVMAGLSGAIRIREGLDYSALPVVAGALGLVLTEDLLSAVGFLERETISIETARQARQARKRPASRRGRR